MCYKGEANKKLWVPFFSFFYALTWTDYIKIFSVRKKILSILVNKIRPKKHKYCKSLENKINVK